MAVELYKATWAMNYEEGGFSFTHWTNDIGYSDVMKKAKTLLKRYLECCGAGVFCKYIRVSKESELGDSLIETIKFGSVDQNNVDTSIEETVKIAGDGMADFWSLAVHVRLQASPSVHGRQFMRGVPDSQIIRPGGILNNPNWKTAVEGYFKALEKDKWGMMGLPKGPGFRRDVLNITHDANTKTTTILTDQDHGVQVGKKFRLSGYRGKLGPSPSNGEYFAEGTPNTKTIVLNDANQAFALLTQVAAFGKLWPTSKEFALYVADQCKIVRVTTRKAGRPLGSPAGRRKKKKV